MTCPCRKIPFHKLAEVAEVVVVEVAEEVKVAEVAEGAGVAGVAGVAGREQMLSNNVVEELCNRDESL
jgi:hypothetical protein